MIISCGSRLCPIKGDNSVLFKFFNVSLSVCDDCVIIPSPGFVM